MIKLPTCKTCGGQNVIAIATLRWNRKCKSWSDIEQIRDYVCMNCGGQSSTIDYVLMFNCGHRPTKDNIYKSVYRMKSGRLYTQLHCRTCTLKASNLRNQQRMQSTQSIT